MGELTAKQIARKERYWRDPEAAKAAVKAWQEANPERVRETWARANARRREYHKERYKQNREKIRAANKAWAEANPDAMREMSARRRARRRNAPVVERIDRGALYERDGGKCHICGKRVPRDAFVLDHLVPLARGGEHTARNLRTAHPVCNLRRGVDALPAQLLLIG